MEQETFLKFFPRDFEPTEKPLDELLKEVRENSFYAHLLVDTLLDETDYNTITTIGNSRYGLQFAIGGRLKNWNYGYFRLLGGWNTNLRLKLSTWLDWKDTNPENFRENLFNTRINEGHEDILTISSDDERYAGISIPIPGHERRLVESDLRIEIAIGRHKLAPLDPNQSLFWWAMSDFIPRFFEEKVKPVANVPLKEMIRWKPGRSDELLP
jgi:hypothetical protein